MAKKFKNSTLNKEYSDESFEFICGNEDIESVAKDARRLSAFEV